MSALEKAKAKPDIWMPFYVSDYLADTMHLSRDEHGAYMLLLMAMWMSNGSLQDDDRKLAAITKSTPREWKSMRPTLASFFIIDQGVWTQKRLTVEMKLAAERKAKAVAKAVAGAHKRWHQFVDIPVDNHPSTNAPPMPQASHKQSLEECTASAPLSTGVVTPTVDARGEVYGERDKYPLKIKPNGNGDWRRNPDEAERKANEVGLHSRPGETIGELVRRIDVVIAERQRRSA